MATFVKGVPAFSPKPITFDLDFAYMERMLKMRQNMYNQGASKVKNLYDSLFSSTMLRDDNIAKRDSYLKTISDSLKNVSGLDFSIGQNVQNAMNLFEPITNDEYVYKDIAYTKLYQSELSKADSYRLSEDAEQRKRYWNEGVKALQYKAEEFKNASKDESLRMSNPRYTPNIDIIGLADKMYKDGKISVKQDFVKDGYVWTMKNGDLAYPITQSMVSTLFSQDPAIREIFKTQAYVQRKDFIKNNADKFGGDETKAEEAYMEQVITNVVNKNRLQLYADDQEVNQLVSEVQSWEKLAKQGKILQGSDDEKNYKAAVEKLRLATELLASKKIDMTIQEINDLEDVEAMRQAVDGAVTMDSYNTLSFKIARYLADKNKEIGVKPDQYGILDRRYNQNISLKNIQAEINRQLEELKQTNREQMEDIQHQNELEVIDVKERNTRTRPRIPRTGRSSTNTGNTNTGNTNTGGSKFQRPEGESQAETNAE